MIKTNLEKLVEVAVSGGAGHACACGGGEAVAYDGGSFVPGGKYSSPAAFKGFRQPARIGDEGITAPRQRLQRRVREIVPPRGHYGDARPVEMPVQEGVLARSGVFQGESLARRAVQPPVQRGEP